MSRDSVCTRFHVARESLVYIRECLIELERAYKLDLNGRIPYKIVYVDESYLHVNHRRDMSCFELDGDHWRVNPEGNG